MKYTVVTNGATVGTFTKHIEKFKSKPSGGKVDDILKSKQYIDGADVISHRVDGLDMNALRDMGDKIREKIGTCGVIILGRVNEDFRFERMQIRKEVT